MISRAHLESGSSSEIAGGTHYHRALPPADGPTVIDLFAGAGGLAEGFRQAGFSILSGNDIDAAARATFRHNFRRASFFEVAISELRGQDLLDDAGLKRGELDCLIGGPPCQSFSYNNHARSRRKARARLFRDYLRIVGELEPRSIVMENVPGILTIGGGAIVEEIYSSLEELGYDCEARTLFAEDFGVPQQRRRVFFIASRVGSAVDLFPMGTHGPAPKPSARANPFVHHWEWPARRRRVRVPTVWSAIGDLPLIRNGGGEEVARHTRQAKTQYQRSMRRGMRNLYNHVAPRLTPGLIERIEFVPPGGNWRDIPHELLPAGMQRARPKDHTKRYGRLEKRGLCSTILTKCDPHWGSYIHPVQDRAISVREAARLQSFPDRFRFLGHRSEQCVQVGNAVPPRMAAAIAKTIREQITS